MKVIKGICNGIDKFNDILGRVFSVLVLGILGVILCEVVLRRIFNRPQIWTQDLPVMPPSAVRPVSSDQIFSRVMVTPSAAGGGICLLLIYSSLTVIFAMLPQMAQHILHIITYLIFLVPFVVSMLPTSWRFFLRAYTTHEQTYSVWAPRCSAALRPHRSGSPAGGRPARPCRSR